MTTQEKNHIIKHLENIGSVYGYDHPGYLLEVTELLDLLVDDIHWQANIPPSVFNFD